MIRIAKRKSRTANATIDFIVGNGNKIPFDKGYFDWVITSLTLHHVAKDWQEKLLAEAFRVLAPGGRLLIVDFGPPCSWLGRIVSVWFWRHAFTKDNLAGSVHQALQQSPWKNIRRVNVQLGLIEYIFATR
jgi:ubiquinone/menaquinone biosynthesis C-methylase UbiE